MRPVTTITINTDASYSQQYKVGGYAFYIVCDLFKITKSGAFKGNIKNPHDAEMKCIANALHTLLAQKELPSCKWLVINTDSQHSIETITRQLDPLGKQIGRMWQQLITRLGSTNNKFRHVRAHSGVKDARSYVNEWCDREAKKYMRQAVNNVKNKKELKP